MTSIEKQGCVAVFASVSLVTCGCCWIAQVYGWKVGLGVFCIIFGLKIKPPKKED